MFKARGLFNDNFDAMNARFDVVFTQTDTSISEKVFFLIKQETRRLENKLSRFNPFSLVSNINNNAAIKPVRVDKEMFKLISLCKFYSEQTFNYFDITTLPLLQYWKKAIADGNSEPIDGVSEILQSVGSDKIELDEKALTLFFLNPIVKIDLGAIGKGFAVQKAKEILMKYQIQNALLNFGNSSIHAMGNHPLSEGWEVGIQNVLMPEKHLQNFNLKDQSLSTSGNTPHNLIDKIKRIGAIINPRTGEAIDGYRCTSVVSSDSVESEVLSTALLVAEKNERQLITDKFKVTSASLIEFSKDNKPTIFSLLANDASSQEN
jgi:FAD:protein FMN transferase